MLGFNCELRARTARETQIFLRFIQLRPGRGTEVPVPLGLAVGCAVLLPSPG